MKRGSRGRAKLGRAKPKMSDISPQQRRERRAIISAEGLHRPAGSPSPILMSAVCSATNRSVSQEVPLGGVDIAARHHIGMRKRMKGNIFWAY